MAVQDSEGVTNVLLVQLRDLELRQKELREGQRSGLELETLVEGNPMRHPKLANEDVDLALVLVVEEEESFVTVQGVEGDVRLVALVAQESRGEGRTPAYGHEIEVAVLARERRRQAAGGAEANGHSPEEPKRNILGGRPCQQPLALCQDISLDPAHGETLTRSGEERMPSAAYSQSVWELVRNLEDDERAAQAFVRLAAFGVATWLGSLVLAQSFLPLSTIAALLAVVFGGIGWRAARNGDPREASTFVGIALAFALALLWVFFVFAVLLRLA
jgi:hypothetical protein